MCARRSRLLVAEPQHFDAAARSLLETHLEVVAEQVDAGGLRAAFGEFDAVWIRLGHRIDAETLGEAVRCRVLAVPATGLDHIDLDACRARGVMVVSLRGADNLLKDVRATAEHTIALLLAALRRLPHAHQSVVQGGWHRDAFRGSEIFEHVVGLIGLGRVGSQVAAYLGAMGAVVIAYDPRDDFPAHLAARCATLDQLLCQADITCLHVSLDPTTSGLIGQRQFAQMRHGVILVNTSRGAVIDETALLDALMSGQVAAAALDVLTDERHIDASHPLVAYARDHDNLVLTPHIAGNTIQSGAKTDLYVARQLIAALGLGDPV